MALQRASAIIPVYGGYSSVAERRSVAADVVGSKPTSRPKHPQSLHIAAHLDPHLQNIAGTGRDRPLPPSVRRHIRLGLSHVEASLLSRGHFRETLPRVLRNQTHLRRSQLHLPRPSHRKDARKLARCDSGELPLQFQGPPAHHSLQATPELYRRHDSVPCRTRTRSTSGQTWPDPLPTPPQFQVRSRAPQRLSDHSGASTGKRSSYRLRVPPRILVHRRNLLHPS